MKNKLLRYTVYAIILISKNVFAEFKPEEVAIIANENSAHSQEIAGFYADVRKIPKTNIVKIATATTFSVERANYEKEILAPIKKALLNPSLKHIKVLVTTYDVPIKVSEINPQLSNPAIKQELQQHIQRAANEFQAVCKEIDQLSSELQLSVPSQGNKNDIKPQEVLARLQMIWNKVNSYENSNIMKARAKNALTKAFGNLNPIDNAIDLKTKKLIEESKVSSEKIDPLHNSFNSEELKTLTRTSSLVFGVAGQISTLKSIYDRLYGEHTAASVDSELTFTLLQNVIPISFRVPNPLFLELDKASLISDPVLLVSRLDGPTPDIVKKNILHGLRIEKSNLIKGNFLIDSRGSNFEDRTEIAAWDRKFTTLARSDFGDEIDIEYDSSPELAEETSDVMFYLGWYRVRNYNDVYSFKPGAIGYHIASEEAVNIHDSQEKGWCKNLLERGVVTTIGAVDEPYLDSFPLPEYFFPLIRTGAYQMVEIYYMATKYLSWRQVLFSDPLYNPYKGKKDSISTEELGFKVLPPLSQRIATR